MIVLPIKRKWFDMILSGEKKEEYRNITSRYTTMFRNAMDEHNRLTVKLRNGYSADSPSCVVHAVLSKGFGKPEWGAEPNVEYFILSITDIEE